MLYKNTSLLKTKV